MSIKEKIDYVKDELSTEEKFFESVVRAEGFYKKYKNIIIATIVIVVVSSIGIKYNNYILLKDRALASDAYNKLLKDSNDSASLEVLKTKNSRLYKVYELKNAIKTNNIQKLSELKKSNIDYISDIASYQLASNSADLNKLSNYALNEKSLLKDLALFQSASILIKSEDYKNAKSKLDAISKESALFEKAEELKHFLITKVTN